MRTFVEDPTVKGPSWLVVDVPEHRQIDHFCEVESIGSDRSTIAAVKTDELGNYGKVLHPKTAVQMDDRAELVGGPASTSRIPRPPPL